MSSAIRNIVIIGGGSAGWLAAGIIASTYAPNSQDKGLRVTLIESPDIKTIGVGEGTWPSMRRTLKRIGLSETDFIRFCNASFKQGTAFYGWMSDPSASYTHPFMPPNNFDALNPVDGYLAAHASARFDDTVCPQVALFGNHLAPKQITTPEYAGQANYGYHLDAGKFATMLQRHCTEQLGVQQIVATSRRFCAGPTATSTDLKPTGLTTLRATFLLTVADPKAFSSTVCTRLALLAVTTFYLTIEPSPRKHRTLMKPPPLPLAPTQRRKAPVGSGTSGCQPGAARATFIQHNINQMLQRSRRSGSTSSAPVRPRSPNPFKRAPLSLSPVIENASGIAIVLRLVWPQVLSSRSRHRLWFWLNSALR